MDVTVQVKGLAEIEARLAEIEGLGAQKLVRRVLRKIAKPMFQQAQANAQGVARSGALAASIKISNRKPKGREVARVSVGSVAKQRTAVYVHNAAYHRQRKGIFYGWMLDQGHASRNGSQVPGRPWFTPAVTATENRATSDLLMELVKAIKRIEKRTSKVPNPDAVMPE